LGIALPSLASAWTPYGYGPYGPDYQPGYPVTTAPSGFRLSREASDDAYSLTIELDGTSPEEVQVRPQGRWIVISREHTEQQVQKDSFGDGRGFTRSFSYSSGTANRRLSVPRDGDLSAMSREDGDGTIRIRIPRKGH
jgi:HSP20 family molecular chaperone IbpA